MGFNPLNQVLGSNVNSTTQDFGELKPSFNPLNQVLGSNKQTVAGFTA